MTSPLEEQKQAILAAILKLAASRLSGAPLKEAETFITGYYNQIDAEDLVVRKPEDLFGAALAHLSFGRTFASGNPKLRVYNPRPDEHGWASPHTVIEIVNDDMPFLVDSIAMEVNRQGHTLHLLVHPLFKTRRDKEDHLDAFVAKTEEGKPESFIHVEVDRETDPARLKALGEGILAALADVRTATSDWPKMRERANAIVAELEKAPAALPKEEVEEGRAFLAWAADNHFTFLGYREYELTEADGQDQLRIVPRSGLGVLREPQLGGLSTSFNELPPSIRKMAREPRLLILTKANTRSTVHRPGYLDYIGVKRFDAAGKVIGERRFVGLYTSSAYHAKPDEVPLLRHKVKFVTARAGFPPASHMGKNLVTVLEDYPRDELIQIDAEALHDTAMGILRLGDRRKTRLFLRRDVYGRFYSAIVYLPRENFNTENRKRIEEILKHALHGQSVEFTVQLSDATLARIYMLVRTSPADVPSIDVRAIETDIVNALRRWRDDLQITLVDSVGEAGAGKLLRTWGDAFPVAYRENIGARAAVRDIEIMQTLGPSKSFALNLYRQAGTDDHMLRLRFYRAGAPLPLSGSLPMLENMGVSVQDEQSYAVTTETGTVHIHDFGLLMSRPLAEIEGIKPLFEEAFTRIWQRDTENDGFNRLVLAAGLNADEIVMLRAYAKYLKQTGFTFSQSYIESTLAAHPVIVRELVALFHSRFEPSREADRDDIQASLTHKIEAALNDVANADEDRILRRFLAAMKATLRTNYYQRTKDGARKAYLSFKFDSKSVPELPEPKPLFEIWVYSPRIEGIHLRFGKVARGGLRWSDRIEDFRTEVLGLVKAQQVKNAVIVPVGSKGGFVLKQPPAMSDREAYMAEGVACYKNFLRGLLDVTDNLVSGKIVPPKDVVRHDPDDPYLVVAADKGTATFSDYANGISAEYGHWLGDAFASGGSAGYDHKKMGITAKGAWESVKRNFREMGIDTQTTDFTVAGVGDMSGDVFGNGMLLSRHIRLLAAFDHRHIFLDPNPESEKSFKERERMFNLPRSSWEDYDKSLISKGGGIFPRTAKSIPLSPEVKKALDIQADSMTPQELMKAILKAPVDLFYNGGIGTYVRASSQSNAEVGDRANDAIRVTGKELRCKVVAEGGNLGCTQLGRIEFAQAGGRIYSDAIDNSAGVDCSDHEVNIKILLGLVEQDGELTEKQRNKLLAEMTDEVGKLVLTDNYYQTQSLSVSGVRGEKLLDAQAAFMRHQEKTGRLNRPVEFLPSDEEIAARRAAKHGLTAPERAVLLAYSKMELFDELIASDLIDDAYVSQELVGYFPTPLQERYKDVMARHPLKREIIATVVANTMINRTGSVFVHRMQEETGAKPHEVARAYVLVRDIFGLNSLWAAIDALDNKVPASVQYDMLIEAGRLTLRTTLWFLRRRRERLPISQVLEIFRPGVAALTSKLDSLLNERDRIAMQNQQQHYVSAGVPEELARKVASLDALYAVLDIVEVATEFKKSADLVAAVYFSLVGKLELRWFASQINALPTDTHWQALARNAMRDDLAAQQRLLTTAVVKMSADRNDATQMLKTWEALVQLPMQRLHEMVNDLKSGPALDLAMLSVVLRELRSLA
jgi:glutamate dehydrogenase